MRHPESTQGQTRWLGQQTEAGRSKRRPQAPGLFPDAPSPGATSYPSPSRYTWVSLQRGKTRPRVQLEELAGTEGELWPLGPSRACPPPPSSSAPTCCLGNPPPGGPSHPGSKVPAWKPPAGSAAAGAGLPPAVPPGKDRAWLVGIPAPCFSPVSHLPDQRQQSSGSQL